MQFTLSKCYQQIIYAGDQIGTLEMFYAQFKYKKLSCRRETARRFVPLNILLSHSRSLKVSRNDTVE